MDDPLTGPGGPSRDPFGNPRGARRARVDPVRLVLLVICLCVATIVLLATRTNVLDAHRATPSVDSVAGRGWCVPAQLPRTAEVKFDELLRLRAELPAVIAALGGRRYTGGVTEPADMWSDDEPRALRSSSLADGGWPAAYEIRWWARDGDDVVADAFAFADPSTARRFLARASAAHCHPGGVSSSVRVPAGGRELVWVNPEGLVQYDLFLRRGRDVFRVADVRAGTRPGERVVPTGARTGVLAVDTLACALPGAGCRRPPSAPPPSAPRQTGALTA